MFVEQCELGFVYVKPQEEVFVSVASLANYLQVMAIDIRNSDELPDTFAEVFEEFATGVERAAKEFEKEVTRVND